MRVSNKNDVVKTVYIVGISVSTAIYSGSRFIKKVRANGVFFT